jgi:hypothetical protein
MHNVLKMIDDCKELMFELLFVHNGGFAFGNLRETFEFCSGYHLDSKIARYENVHKLLEAMP